jgi:hypothetical protein
MHKAWPDLYKRMKAGKIGITSKDRELVVSTRTWLCLYLFEHQYVIMPLAYFALLNPDPRSECHTALGDLLS